MNIWHDIAPELITPERFMAVIEIKRGGKNKYEMDKATGLLRLDRVLYTSTHYPTNYGFIPRTYADDGDPLDVLVLCSEAIEPMTLVECRPIGMFEMNDGEARDEKIIAVPLGDPNYNFMFDISQLPDHLLDEMRHFFTVYKELEGRTTVVSKAQNREVANHVIVECINNYEEKFGSASKKDKEGKEKNKKG
ncbi:MAG TPA: inorganic diphosphatase [Candidatus Ventricola gallistercoris]|nr:inorganic diphosphatase [Candidatus Ventricola gallistercoris]